MWRWFKKVINTFFKSHYHVFKEKIRNYIKIKMKSKKKKYRRWKSKGQNFKFKREKKQLWVKKKQGLKSKNYETFHKCGLKIRNQRFEIRVKKSKWAHGKWIQDEKSFCKINKNVCSFPLNISDICVIKFYIMKFLPVKKNISDINKSPINTLPINNCYFCFIKPHFN